MMPPHSTSSPCAMGSCLRFFTLLTLMASCSAFLNPSQLRQLLQNQIEAAELAKNLIESSPNAYKLLPGLPDIFDAFRAMDDDLVLPTGILPPNSTFQMPNVSVECSLDFAKLVSTDDYKKIALYMVDASGKPGPALLLGNTYFQGLYKECVGINHNGFKANQITILVSNNCSSSLKIYIDLCVPRQCSSEDAVELAAYGMQYLSSSLNDTGNSTFKMDICDSYALQLESKPANTGTVLTLIIVAILVILCVGASVFDFFLHPAIKNEEVSKTVGMKIFRSFSVYTNVKEIFNIKGANKPGNIGPLHCMRVFSMLWVIMGHSLSIYLVLSINPLEVAKLLQDMTTQVVINAYFAVDTFFWQGGLLLAFIWFKQYKKNPKRQTSPVAWVLFYVHRVVRISPPFYLIVAFYTWVYTPLIVVQMPTIQKLQHSGSEDYCTDYWWVGMIYANNLLHYGKQCYLISWYLTTDMQMYIFTPILIIAFTYGPIFGLIVSGTLMSLSTLANILSVLHFYFPPTDYPYGRMDPRMWLTYDHYTMLIYNAAWIRCQIYIIGFVTGYFLQTVKKLRIPGFVQLIGWIGACACVYGCMFTTKNWSLGSDIDIGYSALYSATSKVGWGLVLSWITVACYYGYGSFINAFMSMPIWVPLGRLTYSAFLLHVMVLIHIFGMMPMQLVFSSYIASLVSTVLPAVVLSYFVAIIFSSAVEVATSKVETALISALIGAGYSRKAHNDHGGENGKPRNGTVVTKEQQQLPNGRMKPRQSATEIVIETIRRRVVPHVLGGSRRDNQAGAPSGQQPVTPKNSLDNGAEKDPKHESTVTKKEIEEWS